MAQNVNTFWDDACWQTWHILELTATFSLYPLFLPQLHHLRSHMPMNNSHSNLNFITNSEKKIQNIFLPPSLHNLHRPNRFRIENYQLRQLLFKINHSMERSGHIECAKSDNASHCECVVRAVRVPKPIAQIMANRLIPLWSNVICAIS